MTRRKTSFYISSPSSKLTISLILYTVIILGYNTIINWSSKWFVSTCGMKAISPLTTRISDIFSSPVRRLSCGDSHVILLRYHVSMQPRLHSTKISMFKMCTPWRSNHWLHRLKNPSFIIPNTRLLQESASIKSTALDRIDCYRVRSVQISCKIAISSHQKTSQRARISLIFHVE